MRTLRHDDACNNADNYDSIVGSFSLHFFLTFMQPHACLNIWCLLEFDFEIGYVLQYVLTSVEKKDKPFSSRKVGSFGSIVQIALFSYWEPKLVNHCPDQVIWAISTIFNTLAMSYTLQVFTWVCGVSIGFPCNTYGKAWKHNWETLYQSKGKILYVVGKPRDIYRSTGFPRKYL